jgi:hypothetical protein
LLVKVDVSLFSFTFFGFNPAVNALVRVLGFAAGWSFFRGA